MESLTNEEFRDAIGEFLDGYVRLDNDKPIPRNIPYFREAIKTMMEDGYTQEEIIMACLREKALRLPQFLFD